METPLDATRESTFLEPDRPFRLLARRVLGHHSLAFAMVILGGILLVAIFAPLIAPHDPFLQDLGSRLIPPVWYEGGSWAHVLGTDGFGRDYLSRLLYGARISLIIGFLAMIVSGIIGTTLGALGGYFGGKVDLVVNFLINVRLSVPVVLVALAMAAMFGGSLQMVILILGLLLWARFAVVTRSLMQQIRSADYINAARSLGRSRLAIIVSEALPNLASHIVVIATLEFAHAVILEASLSFLGMGVQPPTPSWGLMIAQARQYIFFDAWLIVIPGVALFMLVMSVNLLGDGIRDLTAPERQN